MPKLRPAFVLAFVMGCCAASPRPDLYRAARPASSPLPVGVVFVANGSGDFRTLSKNLCRVVADTAAPLRVEPFVWSRGFGRYIADHVDHANQVAEGSRLAAKVAEYRRAGTDCRIGLIGHSAGCAVVLAAAEQLPPNAVDRVILLAPSVCEAYDLRPALCAAREGIDAFYSGADSVVLGLGMEIVGTADRQCSTAAGQYGFTPVISGPTDMALYCKLRQHAWSPDVTWSGHNGGHYGSNQPGFLRWYVLPLLRGNGMP